MHTTIWCRSRAMMRTIWWITLFTGSSKYIFLYRLSCIGMKSDRIPLLRTITQSDMCCTFYVESNISQVLWLGFLQFFTVSWLKYFFAKYIYIHTCTFRINLTINARLTIIIIIVYQNSFLQRQYFSNYETKAVQEKNEVCKVCNKA